MPAFTSPSDHPITCFGRPHGRRILLTKRRGTRLFRTIQLYDRRPAIRGGGHDPRAADAGAVKTRLVVVAVVLLQHLGRDHVGREYPGCVYEPGPRAKPLPAAREHGKAAPGVARAFRARGEGHFFCAAVARLSFRRRTRFSAACARSRLGAAAEGERGQLGGCGAARYGLAAMALAGCEQLLATLAQRRVPGKRCVAYSIAGFLVCLLCR